VKWASVHLQGDPLWSARMIQTNPAAISDVHTRYSLYCSHSDGLQL